MIAKMKISNGVSISWNHTKWNCTNCIPTGWMWNCHCYRFKINEEEVEALRSYGLGPIDEDERWRFFPSNEYYQEWWKAHKDLELAFDIPSFRLLPASALDKAEAEIARVLEIHSHHSELEDLHTKVYILKGGTAVVHQYITHCTNNRVPTSVFTLDLSEKKGLPIAKDPACTVIEAVFGGGFTDFPPAEYVLRYLEHLPYLLRVEKWIAPPLAPAERRLHRFDVTFADWAKVDPDWNLRLEQELEWRRERGLTPLYD